MSQAIDTATWVNDLKSREAKTRETEIRFRTQLEAVQADIAKALEEAQAEVNDRKKDGELSPEIEAEKDPVEKLRKIYAADKKMDVENATGFAEVVELREQLTDTISKNLEALRAK